MTLSHDDVQRLLKLLDASQFDEMHLEAEGVKLTLRRHGAGAPAGPAPAEPRAPAASSAHSAPPASAPRGAQPVPATDLLEIRAPMLGTFYGAPKPGAAPFVSVGARVGPDTVVGIIEVMKLMNSIPAGIDGEIVDILVADGALTEFDQVLMRVRRV
jgi:acetyl-CoA carboxylase biotin carboxyl carrier protein